MSNGKDMIIHLKAGFIKRMLYKNESILPKPHEPLREDINVKVDLSNYATKSDLKRATGIDTNLASLKAVIYKKDVGKLKTFPIDLSKISNVVNNDVVKKNCA